jgi:hypothetical protein
MLTQEKLDQMMAAIKSSNPTKNLLEWILLDTVNDELKQQELNRGKEQSN